MAHEEPEVTTEQVLLVFIRQAMEETGWTPEALAAGMGYSDASYPLKVLKGEKPLGATFLVRLPGEVEAAFAKKWAERCDHIVVAPLTGRAAVEALVRGLVGVLAPQLPVRASHMAKASPDIATARKAVP